MVKRLLVVLMLSAAVHLRAQAPSEPPLLRATVDLTIGRGSDETRDAYIFTSIRGLAFDARGRIVVADGRAHRIMVYSPAGVHEITIGREGAGPGDLRSPCCIAVNAANELWVAEWVGRRYSIFNLAAADAPFVRAIRMPTPPAGRLAAIWWDSGGNVIHESGPGTTADGRRRAHRQFVNASGTVVHEDSIQPPPADSLTGLSFTRTIEGGTARNFVAQPFGAHALRASGPNGEAAAAVSSRYSVAWLDSRGRTMHVIERHVTPPAVSRAEREREEADLRQYAERFSMKRSDIPFDVPRVKAPLEDIGFDHDGRLWIQRAVADGAASEADVYDRAGKLVARMEWPRHIALELSTVKGAAGLGIVSDSLGAQSVVRVRFR